VPNGGKKRTGQTGEPMFVVLDTNHFAELVHDTVPGGRLKQRFLKRSAQVFTTIKDLKIAAVCLEHEATILTRNVGDFIKVPGLRVENWLD